MNSTTTCTFFDPRDAMGFIPDNQNRPFQFAQSECVTVIPENNSTSTAILQVFNPSTTISSTSPVEIYGFFSAGEILIAFLIMVVIAIMSMYAIASALSNVKTKKRFLQYHGGDVEIRDDN